MISIKKCTSTNNTTRKTGRSIKYIVIHYTAGTSSKAGAAKNVASYFAKASTKASADFIVDDATIVQFNPDIGNRYCWHCGGSKYSTKGGTLYGKATNANSIGIEICSTSSTGKVASANSSAWSFSSAALEQADKLVKYLMQTYDIGVDCVIRHYDVTGKLCPGIKGWNKESGSEAKWTAFKAGLVASSGSSATSSSSSTASESSSYLVKVTASVLNVREGPGTKYAITTTVKKGGVYTIVDEQSNWGKLKSGAGWISLNYVKKL